MPVLLKRSTTPGNAPTLASGEMAINEADSTLFFNRGGTVIAIPLSLTFTPQGRLSLTSGTPVTTSDVSAATAIYYTPAVGSTVSLYDGTSWLRRKFAQLTLSLSATYQTATNNYDLFLINDSGTLRLGHGPAWSSSSARGTGAGTTEIEVFDGLIVNKNTMTVRWGTSAGDTFSAAARTALYLGSFAVTTAGQVNDTATLRHLFNNYNRAVRPWSVTDTTATWTYSTATWRQVRATAANRVSVMIGRPDVLCEVEASAVPSSNNANPVALYTGIGFNSTTVNGAESDYAVFRAANIPQAIRARYRGPIAAGLNSVNWLELGGGDGNTQTWNGTNGGANVYTTGLRGSHLG